jgi:hypothetical protein
MTGTGSTAVGPLMFRPAGDVDHTFVWGEMTPSVPPDMIIATRLPTSWRDIPRHSARKTLRGRGGEAAGPIIDAAIALDLGQHGDDVRWIDGTGMMSCGRPEISLGVAMGMR